MFNLLIQNPEIFYQISVGVMVSALISSAVDRGFELLFSQTKDYEITNCCFVAMHPVLRSKNKDQLPRNLGNVSE